MKRGTVTGEGAATGEVASLRDVICANLNRFVDEAGASRSDIARAVGVTPAAVAKWLSGDSNIGPDNIKPVCDFLGVPIHALLGEESTYTEVSGQGRKALALLSELGEEGQSKALAYLEDLVATGKYGRSG